MALQPVLAIGEIQRGVCQHGLEGSHKPARGARVVTGKPPIGREDEPKMGTSSTEGLVPERAKVDHVLGDDRPGLLLGRCEDSLIGSTTKIRTLCDGDRIAVSPPERLRDVVGPHLV